MTRSSLSKIRLAFIVSHPIQYYVPLYQRLAQRPDIIVKVFYTWHDGRQPILDQGFRKKFIWDIPLTEGYEYELVPNISSKPGTHHFWGMKNPQLFKRIMEWHPQFVHLTGYSHASHLNLLYRLFQNGIPVLFRGDSHLLNGASYIKKVFKKKILKTIFKWPTAFLYVGTNNYNYYREYGVPHSKLFYCPHSIDVARFIKSSALDEKAAQEWRRTLEIADDHVVVLFAGKFEQNKQPLALMKSFLALNRQDAIMLMVGDGALECDVRALAHRWPSHFRVLPFQNQKQMPVLYRTGDLFVLPSDGETWGLAVNEAMACGRPVLVSNRVGCAVDLIKPGISGDVFEAGNLQDMTNKLAALISNRAVLANMGKAAFKESAQFDINSTEEGLMKAVRQVCAC